jgi:hypothetical protein
MEGITQMEQRDAKKEDQMYHSLNFDIYIRAVNSVIYSLVMSALQPRKANIVICLYFDGYTQKPDTAPHPPNPWYPARYATQPYQNRVPHPKKLQDTII